MNYNLIEYIIVKTQIIQIILDSIKMERLLD